MRVSKMIRKPFTLHNCISSFATESHEISWPVEKKERFQVKKKELNIHHPLRLSINVSMSTDSWIPDACFPDDGAISRLCTFIFYVRDLITFWFSIQANDCYSVAMVTRMPRPYMTDSEKMVPISSLRIDTDVNWASWTQSDQWNNIPSDCKSMYGFFRITSWIP